MRRAAARADDGSITILTAGLVAVLLAAVLTVAAATHVQLQRLRLQHVADEVALAAADALDADAYYAAAGASADPDGGPPLSTPRVGEEAADQATASSLRQGLPPVALTRAEATPDGRVSVAVATRVPVLFGVAWLPGRVDLTASAQARAALP